jgi:hypothetical protein
MVIHHIGMVILDIDMGHGLMIWDDSIDMIISNIDMGYLVNLAGFSPRPSGAAHLWHVPMPGLIVVAIAADSRQLGRAPGV